MALAIRLFLYETLAETPGKKRVPSAAKAVGIGDFRHG
jgi:hypothetical protein